MELGLPARQHVAHPLDANRGLRLQPRQLDHLCRRGLLVALAQRPHGHDDQAGQYRQPREDDDGRAGEGHEIVGHSNTLHRFVA